MANENENSRANAVTALTAQFVQAALSSDSLVLLNADPDAVARRAAQLAEAVVCHCEDIHEAAARAAN